MLFRSREFVETAFRHVGMTVEWSGTGVNEVGIDKETGKMIVSINPAFFRPAEVEILLGDATKAESKLGWKREVSFSSLVERMVENDLKLVEKEIEVSNLS